MSACRSSAFINLNMFYNFFIASIVDNNFEGNPNVVVILPALTKFGQYVNNWSLTLFYMTNVLVC